MHKKCLRSALRLASFVFATMAQGASVPVENQSFPQLTFPNLNDVVLTLPRDLPTDPSIVLLAFEQKQQSQVDTWIPRIAEDFHSIEWIEVPVIQPSNAFVRGMIAAGMRREISDLGSRSRVVTAYEEPDRIASSVGCGNFHKQMCAAVVNRKGRVLAHVNGPYSAALAETLLRALPSP